MKKLLLILVLFFLCITCTYASTDNVYNGKSIPNVYIKKVGANKTSYRQGIFINKASDGGVLYCVEPFKLMRVGTYQTYKDNYAKNLGISNEVWNRISLIAYYGYGYKNHKDVKWYTITQIMIWREIDKNSEFYFTDKLNGNKINKYDGEINEIYKLVNNHYKLPSFANNKYNFSIDSKNVLIDENNLLSEYIVESNNDVKVYKENNKLYIDTNGEISTTTLNFSRRFDAYNNVPVAFVDSSAQKLIAPGNLNPIKFKIDLEIDSGIIKINKLDFDTQEKKPQGEGILIGSTYNIYDSNNNIVDTLIIGNDYTATSKKLPYGKYSIREVKSMSGYYLDNTSYEIDINKDNLVNDINFANKVIKSKLIIYKHCGGQLEEGVWFEIYDRNNNLVDKVVTDFNGKIEIELPYGTYLFHQLNSKKNYKKVEDFQVKVNSESKRVQTLDLIDEEFSSKIKIIKIDGSTGSVIDDSVTFRIFDILNDKYITIDGITDFTAENGVLIIDKLKAGNYYLEEIESPKGYMLNNEKIYFQIDDEDEFQYDGDTPLLEIRVINNKEKITIDVPDTSKDTEQELFYLVDKRKYKNKYKKINELSH